MVSVNGLVTRRQQENNEELERRTRTKIRTNKFADENTNDFVSDVSVCDLSILEGNQIKSSSEMEDSVILVEDVEEMGSFESLNAPNSAEQNSNLLVFSFIIRTLRLRIHLSVVTSVFIILYSRM